jgi:allantoicase
MNFKELIDLAAERVGGAVLFANDEFFAPKENLLKPGAPVFIEGKYTDLGKWMDGWETRRKRTPGYDWCLIRLGLPGIIRGVLVDTSYFKGNYPEQCSLEACAVEGQPDAERLMSESTEWTEVLQRSQLQGDSQNPFAIEDGRRFTHLRFNIFPDGGVARLRVYGEVLPDWERLARRGSEVDLAAVEHGATVIVCSDMFFGHRHNLIMPGRALDMSDGWETRRRRGPGHDWAIIRLGARGALRRVEVDTAHFKGNYPESCSLEACHARGVNIADWTEPSAIASLPWMEVLARTKLQAHTRHFFEDELQAIGPVTHLRFNIFPDGGVSRLRAFGSVAGDF